MLRPLAPAFFALLLLAPSLRAESPAAETPTPEKPDLETPATADSLWAAALGGDAAEVARVLDAGVPVDAPQRHGMTALGLAAGAGHLEVVRLLLERGANPDAEETFWGTTPVMRALQGGHAEAARLLLDAGASWGAQTLYMTVGAHPELVPKLLEARPLYAFERDDALALGALAAPREVLDQLRAAEVRDEVPSIELPASRLETYAGAFGRDGQEGDAGGLELAVVEGGLELRGEGLETTRFTPLSSRHFRSVPGAEVGLFVLSRAGLVDGFLLLQRGLPPASFRRLEDAGHRVATSTPPASHADDNARRATPRGPDREWPSFRGASASGVADGQGAVVDWDLESGHNVRWRAAVPGLALSSPVVAGGRVFLTTAVSEGDQSIKTGRYGDPASVADDSKQSWQVLALDAESGRELWRKSVDEAVPGAQRHLKSSHANSTPASDGERVVAVFPTAGLVALDAESGELLWRRGLGDLASGTSDGLFEWGFASSPILWRGLVILQVDVNDESYIAAFDLETGEERWRTAREEIPTWSTPTVAGQGASAELVTSGTTVRAYDPRSGRELWSLGPMSEIIIATPVAANGLVYVTAGYPPIRPIYAVRLGSRGDLTLPKGHDSSDAVAWSHRRGGGYMPTPVVYRGLFYMPHHNGRLVAYDATSGEEIYRARFSQRGTLTGSPIAGDGLLYFPTEEGLLYVVEAGREYRELAVHDFGSAIMTTPALAAGRLYVRTLEHLVALGEEPPGEEGDAKGEAR